MISGKMYFYSDPEMIVPETVEWLIKTYNIQNIECVLVNPAMIKEEITLKNIKITPKMGVLLHHYWFISENKAEIYPEFEKSEK